ncbi:hypothetical protein [Amycolatopsis sp. NPDC051071]|uniref:hypothetical protein n=1 Tax=Amycolatopsis sp. NPDC051071 TaxID=3154637 RepID=UPI00341C27B0
MSHQNHATRTAPAPDTAEGDRHLRAVADAPGQQNVPTTEDKVREALTDNPGATTAAVAMTAEVGRSTAAKILARWGRDGTAIRTAGDGPRNPDTWTLTPSDRATAAPSTEDAQPDATAAGDTAENTGTPEERATVGDATAAQETETPTGPEPADDTEPTATDTTDYEAPPSADAETDDDGTTTPPPGTPADGVTKTEAEPSPAGPSTATGTVRADTDRLPKGGLRALVEEYLTDHPGETFGPATIGKELRRSGGAVNNALEKLVADGYARRTCEAPKRFAINPDKTDVPDTTKDAAEPARKA